MRGRVVVAAVAAGALATAGQSISFGAESSENAASDSDSGPHSRQAAASFGDAARGEPMDGMGGSAPAPQVLPVTKSTNPGAEVDNLVKSQRINAERIAAEAAAEAEAKRPKFVSPADGNFTSGFGGRWGTTHYGIDIANSTGTPIKSVADGTVVEAGPASGFGMWVRVQHGDGTTTVYGHIDQALASEGQTVKAGEQIATMGNRGYSTGTHLHFEVWEPGGQKINPLPWLAERGINIR